MNPVSFGQEGQSHPPSPSAPDEYSDINPPDVSTNEYDYVKENGNVNGNTSALRAVNRDWSRDHQGYICSIWPS